MEFATLLATFPALRRVRRADPHPVLVIPGFVAGDGSTSLMRLFLRRQGYWVHGWHLGRNLGPTPRVMAGLEQRLIQVSNRHHAPVSIVGWSLGGIYARMLAQRHPDLVRQVITLGSPFRLEEGDSTAFDPLWNRLAGSFTEEMRELRLEMHQELSMPSTAIFTKTDGVIDWRACLEFEGPRRESIEVMATHAGLAINPAVLVAVNDRLSRKPSEWKPFRPPKSMTRFYGKPRVPAVL